MINDNRSLKMVCRSGFMSLLLKVVIWITFFILSEGADSSSICPGQTNHVTSSENYTEVSINRRLRPYESCAWVIESGACSSDNGVEVEITLTRFRGDDSVTLYDGPSTKYPVIPLHVSRWGYNENLPSKRSSGRYMTVVFLFQHHDRVKFRLSYRTTPIDRFPSNTENPSIENSDTCWGDVLLASKEPKIIASPGYPSQYHNELNCKWKVISDDKCNNDVIQVTIHSLSLNGSDDHLIIFDGDSEFAPVLVKLSGQVESQVIMSTGTAIVIEFNTDDAATGQGFNLSYTRTNASPLLAEQVSINITDHTVVMAVEFISGTPHRAVYWSRNGMVISQDAKHTFTVNPALVTMEPNVSSDGFKATLTITGPDPSDFGRYKVAVINKFGVSERVLLLRRGQSVPVIQSHAVFPENASITVTFLSHPIFKIEWYKRERSFYSGSDIQNVTTERLGDNYNGEANEALFKSVLSSANPTELAYGDYMCIIRNDIGTTEISFDMKFPGTELPKVLVPSPTVLINEQDIILSVNFDSNLVHPSATWYIGEVEIESSDKYTMELTWEGIDSSDWQVEGYPVFERSQNFKLVSGATHYYYSGYQYPSIGSNRSSTQPNAYYTAMLTISKMTLEDFGSYRVVLENEAGKSHHVIEVPTPEVFPYITCDQADTIQLVCNVTSCPSVTQSWIHSVNGEVIRNLSGHQDGPINTLTIPLCMYPDAGTYTCVATDIKSGNNVKLHQGKTTLVVKAVPVILEPTVDIQREGIQVEVPFLSHPPYRWVTWHRNGNPVSSSNSDILETGPRDVILPMYGKMSSQAGNVTSIRVRLYSMGGPQYFAEFGIFKLTIGNDLGSSVHYIDVQNPLYANPVVSSDVKVSMSGASAILIVNFFSYHPYLSVKWYFRGEEVQGNQPVNKYEIQTSPSHDVTDSTPLVKHSDSTILTITSVSEEDYGMYKVIVSNDAGQAVIPVALTVHGEGLPKIVGEMTTVVSNSTGELSATFYSPTSYGFIRWLKQDNEITNDLSKYVIINEDIDIEILFSGETVVKSGTKTTLRVTSLNDKDYGRYSVQIYNDAGMTERSTTLQKECT